LGLHLIEQVNNSQQLNFGTHLLTESSEQISTELAMYCIAKGKNKLPFLKKGEGKWFLDDIDFLLRFWKKTNYHARPEITFTGGNG
jgi:hypothetical protein